jgi:hypothetical protein
MDYTGSHLSVREIRVEKLPRSLDTYEKEITDLTQSLRGTQDGVMMPVRFEARVMSSEEYSLSIRAGSVRITAGDPRGALHAIRTLVDLWDSCAGGVLPEVTVRDRPTFAVRGVFVESFAGSDRMDLGDWKQLINRFAQLKFNILGVSIYGCWDLRHGGERSEYLFTPLRDFPHLSSPQHMVTWDPAKEQEAELTYLPFMFESDFFGDLVRHAQTRGMDIVPHLGGPGHSTLLPRLMPDLSALDEAGKPTGYGYCVSRPEARDALAHVVRCLVEQHLRPNRIRRLHVAGDEYYPIRNVDPEDRLREVSPYCRCEGCQLLTPGEMLIEYLVHVGAVLAEYGISMVNWHDTLVREGVLEEYSRRLDAAQVPRPVVAWWKYNDPIPTPDARLADAWSCPTTGLFPHLFFQNFSANIESVLRRGHAAGTRGVFAYGLPDPADHQNYACLADLSWNLEASHGASGFHDRWALHVSRDDPDSTSHAFSVARTVTGSYPLMMYLVQQVLPYFSTAAAGVTRYPDDLLRAFSIVQPPLRDLLRQVTDTLREAVSVMPEGADVRLWPNPVTQWKQECERTAVTLELFGSILDAVRGDTEADIMPLSRRSLDALRLTARCKPSYLAPAALREQWILVQEMEPAIRRLKKEGNVPGAQTWHAWIV